uniref:MICOS complex subunit MIC13 n=1 Tax=Graphocephala atropunctata TaxID=36148 RepID=A0A1B6MHF4_9HEMI
MTSKQVISKSLPLLNSRLNNPSVATGGSLLPKTDQPFLLLKSTEMTQATTISPTGVHPRGPMGPCRAPNPICPPPPCACPPPSPTITLGKRIFRAIWFLTKLGLFVGVVKFTVDEGLWGDSEETEELAKRLGIVGEKEKEEKEKESQTATRGMWDTVVLKAGEFFGLEA